MSNELTRPIGPRAVHLCVDMQRIFSSDGLWATPWLERVLPVVTEIAGRFPERTIFTRFVTPGAPDHMPGTWRRYYEKWRAATREHLDPKWLELLPPLAKLVPPAAVIDKMRYSAFTETVLLRELIGRRADSLIVTGSETDVCVLATVLDAVDRGLRVILVRDAVCSSSDEGHEAMLRICHGRYSEQIETADADEVLSAWARESSATAAGTNAVVGDLHRKTGSPA